MKILTPPKPKRNTRTMSHSCGCKFEFELSEASTHFDRNESYKTISCPGCGESIAFDSSPPNMSGMMDR